MEWLLFKTNVVYLLNERKPTNAKTLLLPGVQRELPNTYQKEQLEYIQGQIHKIKNLKQRKEVNGRKNGTRVKLKASNQEKIPQE